MPRPKFVPGKVMDFTRKIRDIVEKTECKRHNVPEGVPCFHLRMGSQEGYFAGICNVRATKVYNGGSTKVHRNFSKEKR